MKREEEREKKRKRKGERNCERFDDRLFLHHDNLTRLREFGRGGGEGGERGERNKEGGCLRSCFAMTYIFTYFGRPMRRGREKVGVSSLITLILRGGKSRGKKGRREREGKGEGRGDVGH